MKTLPPIGLLAAVLVTVTPLAAAPKARLTMAQARAAALKLAPGKIVDAEYEKEAGTWRYSFDIRQGKRVREIGIDANSGKVVENDIENPADKD